MRIRARNYIIYYGGWLGGGCILRILIFGVYFVYLFWFTPCLGGEFPAVADKNAIITVKLIDDKQRKASVALYRTVDDTGTLASILAAANVVVGYVDAICDAKVYEFVVSIQDAPASAKSDPVAGCDVEETGLFTFAIEGVMGDVWSIDVPGIESALVEDGGDLNLADTHVTSFTTSMTNNFQDRYRRNLAEVLRGRQTFRKQ